MSWRHPVCSVSQIRLGKLRMRCEGRRVHSIAIAALAWQRVRAFCSYLTATFCSELVVKQSRTRQVARHARIFKAENLALAGHLPFVQYRCSRLPNDPSSAPQATRRAASTVTAGRRSTSLIGPASLPQARSPSPAPMAGICSALFHR